MITSSWGFNNFFFIWILHSFSTISIASKIEQLEYLPPQILYMAPLYGFLKNSQKQFIKSKLCKLSLTCFPLYPIRVYFFFSKHDLTK